MDTKDDATMDLDWRNALTDGFDEDFLPNPGAPMDIGKRKLEAQKTFEAMKNYNPPEFDPANTPAPRDYSDSDEDFEQIEEEANSEEAQAQIKALEQESYKLDARFYQSEKCLGPDQEERFCIWPGGIVSWNELSSGYSWICISGNDTTCVVTMCDPIRKRPDNKTRLCPYTVLKGALADMIGDTPHSFRKIPPQEFHSGHLAVVSVASYAPDQELELRSLEKRRSLLFRFLQEKLEDCSTFSYKETEEIAICALKLLLGRTFNPYKIEVCGWGNSNVLCEIGFRLSSERVKEALTSMVRLFHQ